MYLLNIMLITRILLNCHLLITNFDSLSVFILLSEVNNLSRCCYSHFVHESTIQGVFKKSLMNESGGKDFPSGIQNIWI